MAIKVKKEEILFEAELAEKFKEFGLEMELPLDLTIDDEEEETE